MSSSPEISPDALTQFKEAQKQSWVHFTALEALTTPAAAVLVKRAQVAAGRRVLDVACGTGVVAVTAARLGAHVTGLDLTPELLERARENARLASVEIEWRQGDVEELPFDDATFDIVLSQFGHIFAPRPDVAVSELLRVLKPGGTIAFATWPPELYIGRLIALLGRYLPEPPAGVVSPALWGDPSVIRERLGAGVADVTFDRARMPVPALSPQHMRAMLERTSGQVMKLVESLTAADPARLATFRRELDELIAGYFEDNLVRQDYLITRATKV
ncbi:MAG: methyltransferase domain-containing protein [Luteitalea sp.]|nr:methyltransferase domain-containing protein [Luteitalea sp.]